MLKIAICVISCLNYSCHNKVNINNIYLWGFLLDSGYNNLEACPFILVPFVCSLLIYVGLLSDLQHHRWFVEDLTVYGSFFCCHEGVKHTVPSLKPYRQLCFSSWIINASVIKDSLPPFLCLTIHSIHFSE